MSTATVASARERSLLLIVLLAGVVLCFSGWRAAYDGTSIDEVGNRDNVRVLVEEGKIPVTSGLSLLGTYNPAGSSWYFLPSLIFEDVRLGERFAGALLYLLTALGLYLLAKPVAGWRLALLLVTLYTVSSLGLFFEHTLRYRARPFAYVWLAYFLTTWIHDRRKWALAGAIVSTGYGILINFEMLPVLAGVAAVVWRFKPRFDRASAAVGAAAVILMWTPFLGMQVDRGFEDLVAVATQSHIGVNHVEVLDSSREDLVTWSSEAGEPSPYTPTHGLASSPSNLLKRILILGYRFGRVFPANFADGHPLGVIPLLLACLFLLTIANQLRPATGKTWWPTVVGWILVASALLLNQFTLPAIIGRPLTPSEITSLQIAQSLFVTAGIVLLARRWMSDRARALAKLTGFTVSRAEIPDQLRILAWFVLPTWLAFAVVARFERFTMGFWAVQLLLVALSVVMLPRLFGMTKRGRYAGIALALLLVLPNGRLQDVFSTWSHHGFGGRQLDLMDAADLIASTAKARKIARVNVGYLLYFGHGYQLAWGVQDPSFGGLGRSLQQYFDVQHNLRTAAQPPSGFAESNQFRIVQLEPTDEDNPHRFSSPDGSRFHPIGRFGPYEVVERELLATSDIRSDTY